MVRSIGIAAVVAGLAWTGLAGAQSSSPPGPAASGSRYIIVSEEGQQPQRCKVLKTWHESNGVPAFQVQAVDTGEMMTIIGSGPAGASGDPRAMSTRIFRWGRDNKPPAGVPMPPPTATTQTAPPARSVPMRPTPVVTPQPIRLPLQPSAGPALTKAAQPAPAPLTARKPEVAPTATPKQRAISYPIAANNKPAPSALDTKPAAIGPYKPLSPSPMNTQVVQYSYTPPADAKKSATSTAPQSRVLPITSGTTIPAFTSSKPATSTVAGQTAPVVPSKPSSLTPLGTPVIQYSSAPTSGGYNNTTNVVPEERLKPVAGGIVPPNSNCACNSCCNNCGQACGPCNPSSCVNGTPSPLRQTFMGKLFKSNTPCSNCTEMASQPAQPLSPKPAATIAPVSTVAKAPKERAKPRDWRESWGKVEASKGTTPCPCDKPASVVTKRVDPMQVKIEQPKQPDPLKAPDQYRDLAMQSQLTNSKIPDAGRSTYAPRLVSRILPAKQPTVAPLPPARPVEETVVANAQPASNYAMPSASPAAPPSTQPRGRVIQLAADEPNAFWSPEKPPKKEAGQPEQEKPRINAFEREENDPQAQPQRMPMPQRMPPGMNFAYMPAPPRGPLPMLPQGPPMPPMNPTMGVPDAMGNAFTLPGTRRPIPADFGGTPQEPNGFDPMVQMGQGSPPQAYGMGMPGMMRPPMPNMMAMGPGGPMGFNPLMSVPPTLPDPRVAAPVAASAPAAGVPQLLATLKDSLCPSEREAAVEQLSELNAPVQPQVVQGLMKSAREDPAATVRAACIHALAHMKVDSAEAVALVRQLKADRDPRVRQEAEVALSELGDSGIQQTSHKQPR